MSYIRLYGNSADAFGQRKEEGACGLRDKMNKRRFLPVLALGMILVLLFAVSGSAGSLLECKGELPGGYTFTGPEEITVSIDVRNAGDEDFPGPVELYYPDLTQVEEFGSPTLAAGSSRNWEALCPRGFPGSSEGKASACNVGDLGLIPRSGRVPEEGNGNPLQYPWLENSMGRGAWWATVHGIAKSQTRLSD